MDIFQFGVIVFFILCFWMLYIERTRPKPGLFPFPIFGNTITLFRARNEKLQFTLRLVEKFGTTFHSFVPVMGHNVYSAEPESAEFLLTTNFEDFKKGSLVSTFLGHFLGKGIFVVDGEEWKVQRKTFSHLFKVSVMKNLMSQTFIKHGELLLNILEKHSKSKKEINTNELFYFHTLDSIGYIAFGEEIGCLKENSKPAFAAAFDYILDEAQSRFDRPLWPFTPNSELDRQVKILKEFAHKIIRERRSDPKLDEKEDLLSNYIRNTDANDEYLCDVMMNFLIAGRDTTGQTLTWLFHLLSLNPNVEDKLIKEIDQYQGQLPDYDELKKGTFPYLDACIQETLRLYPPVPHNTKIAQKDVVLPNGVKLAEGDNLTFSSWGMGRNGKVWENVNEFKPERFLAGGEASKKHKFQHIPFQAGPRVCLGQRMALFELQLLVIQILQKYTLKMAPNFKFPKAMYNITIGVENGTMLMIPKKR